jgi:RimJ/RimL family protein N-acetyltransferase
MKEESTAFTFRKVCFDDIPLLLTWFKNSHIQQWWPTPEKDEFFEHFLKRIRSKDTFAFLALLNGTPIGYIQYYYIDRSSKKAGAWLPELPETTVGTDQFIGDPEYIGKGYGTAMIKDFIVYLTSTLEPHVTTIIVDPHPDNAQAIRFRPAKRSKRCISRAAYSSAIHSI